MMNIKTLVAVGAAMTLTVMSGNSFAQDDLDDLLKDLEGEAVAEAPAPAEEEAEAGMADESEPEEDVAEAVDSEEVAEEASADAEESAEEIAEEAEEEVDEEAEEASDDDSTATEEPAEPEEEVVAETNEEALTDDESAPASEAPAATENEEDAEEVSDEGEEATPAEEEPAPAAEEEPSIPAPVAEEEIPDEVDNVISLLNELSAEVDAKDQATEDVAPSAEENTPDSEEVVPAVEETTPAPAKQAIDPKAELLANVRATEKIRIEALEIQAKRTMKDAQEAMKAGDYTEAVRQYTLAYKWLGDRPTNRDLKKICEHGIAEGLYREAVQNYELGRRETAKTIMQEAVKMRHPKAAKTLEKWLTTDEESFRKPDLSEITHVRNEASYKLERSNIRKHLKRSRQYLAVKDIDKALEECELVIVNDPYNQEALKLRSSIIKKKAAILQQERDVARDGMIAEVDRVWRPLYAPNSTHLDFSPVETQKVQVGEDLERTMEQDIEKRMKEMRLPTIAFKPPATLVDAIDFFRQASKDYDRPDIPIEKRGFNFVLKTDEEIKNVTASASDEDSDDFSSTDNEEEVGPSVTGVPVIPTITASDITFYEALKLVTDQVGYKFRLRGSIIMIMPASVTIDEFLTRNYNVPDSLSERVENAAGDIKEMKASSGFGSSSKKSSNDDDDEDIEKKWMKTFEQLGVAWPEGSHVYYIKSLGKLRVVNTAENLALMEQALSELGGVVKLIEIETRFVEVSQEDLNSLGFEWILNSDYNLDVGSKLGKALGVKKAGTITTGGEYKSGYVPVTENGATRVELQEWQENGTTRWQRGGDTRNVNVNAMGGASDYGNGNRYLSQTGNHISGQGNSNNDQFMRVNAFLGNADLSMILHMLSQRSDTDLLSAPKVVTKSGTEATIKVVTEYIYPTDYNVQLQSSTSSSGSNGSSSAILAIVEPENFQTRPVGVILTVTPTYTETNGGLIDLELNPQVVDEPTWKNYGMKIPFTGNSSLENFEGIGGIFDGLSSIFETLGESIPKATKALLGEQAMDAATSALDGLTRSNSDNMTYYDAPMEQPFFHVREVNTTVSINPGSTVVLGGLITEQRKAMDDKVPFLGDLPFIGRLFRSHAEQTVKRNLLIFVTGRLITPSGREVRTNDAVGTTDDEEVKSAPMAD